MGIIDIVPAEFQIDAKIQEQGEMPIARLNSENIFPGLERREEPEDVDRGSSGIPGMGSVAIRISATSTIDVVARGDPSASLWASHP